MSVEDEISVDDLVADLDNLQIRYDADEEPLLVKKNTDILSDMIAALVNNEIYSRWVTTDFEDEVFQLIELEEYTSEYQKIKALFDNTMRRYYTVDKIQRVENPYLLLQHVLNKMKKNCSEETLFHGTSQESIKPICTENFNWRLSGSSFGHKFGKGISFSPESTYSSHYPQNGREYPRIMFVTNVLIKSSCIGGPSMIIPIDSADTSIKPDGKVVVKYEDNDFYPEYIIYYS